MPRTRADKTILLPASPLCALDPHFCDPFLHLVVSAVYPNAEVIVNKERSDDAIPVLMNLRHTRSPAHVLHPVWPIPVPRQLQTPGHPHTHLPYVELMRV
jgi:hypothetical protein